MAVTKQQKTKILADLTAKFKAAKSIGFAKTNALSVAEFEALRVDLRGVQANYTLAKKTLMRKALKDALDLDLDLADLPGQIGAVCSNEDAIAGLGKVNELVKKTKGEKIEWAVCVFEGELKDNEATKAIAGMPSRETLLGRLVGSMQSPLAGLARWFDAAAKDIETAGKTKVSELEGKKEETATVAVETPKNEEIKEEAPVADTTPAEEVKAE